MEIIETVLKWLSTIEGSSATIIVALEFILRLLPTKKPLSVLYVVSKVVHQGAALIDGVSMIVKKLAKILDKVLPQNSEEK
jgi:hypothetical protein